MTTALTIPTDSRRDQECSGPSLSELTLAVPTFTDTDRRRDRIARVRNELDDIAADEWLAARMNGLATRAWRAELAAERTDCWEAVAHIATNT